MDAELNPEVQKVARLVARRASQALPEPGLEFDVERLVRSAREVHAKQFDFAVIELATLIVAASGFAWQVFRDTKQSTDGASNAASVKRECHARLIERFVNIDDGIESKREVEIVLDIVVEETTRLES